MYKQRLLVLVAVALLLITPATPLAASGFDVSARAAVLMESSTGQILYEKNGDEALPPASITKLMTLLLIFEALESGKVSLDDTVIASEAAWRMGGSEMFLDVNQEVRFGDLVTGISVISANDGCIAAAEHLAGSEEAFVRQMNERAAELGLSRTRFKNSTGIPAPGHEMSARDIAVLARYLIENHPGILELETQREFTFNNIRQYNRNPLLGRYPGADGLKTGWTEEAGFCLVGTALQDGIRMISVILGTESEQERLVASRELLNHGFRNFRLAAAVEQGQKVGSAPVKNGKKPDVEVAAANKVTVVVPVGRENDLVLAQTDVSQIEAPVASGTRVGTLEVRLDGERLAATELVTAEEVARANIFVRFFRAIGSVISGLFGKTKR